MMEPSLIIFIHFFHFHCNISQRDGKGPSVSHDFYFGSILRVVLGHHFCCSITLTVSETNLFVRTAPLRRCWRWWMSSISCSPNLLLFLSFAPHQVPALQLLIYLLPGWKNNRSYMFLTPLLKSIRFSHIIIIINMANHSHIFRWW